MAAAIAAINTRFARPAAAAAAPPSRHHGCRLRLFAPTLFLPQPTTRLLTTGRSIFNHPTRAAQDGVDTAGAEEPPRVGVPEGDEGDAVRSEEAKSGASVESLAELKAEVSRRRESGKKDGSVFDGVMEEMGEIEWPAVGKVVGTTWVVLAVIAGSTVALLSVNGILAELSDRVFAGRGLQDFF